MLFVQKMLHMLNDPETFPSGTVLRGYDVDMAEIRREYCTCERHTDPATYDEIKAYLGNLGKIVYQVEYLFSCHPPHSEKIIVDKDLSGENLLESAILIYDIQVNEHSPLDLSNRYKKLEEVILTPLYEEGETISFTDLAKAKLAINVANTLKKENIKGLFIS